MLLGILVWRGDLRVAADERYRLGCGAVWRISVHVETCLVVVNIASGAAEADILMSTGACKQKHLHFRTCRRRRRFCSPPAGHAGVIDTEPGPGVVGADRSGPGTHS